MFKKLFSRKKIAVSTTKEANVDVGTNINVVANDKKQQLIRTFLQDYRSPSFPQGILAVCQQQKLQYLDNRNNSKDQSSSIVISIVMPFPCQSELAEMAKELSVQLNTTVTFDVTLDVKPVRSHQIDNVSNIIAIASGKGGVGKSTTTVNVAYALMAEGATVGILDADIYGPSIPALLGLKGKKPSSVDGKSMIPLESNGLCAMSIGFLVDEADATVWRGPMASSAFGQLLNETAWPKLDYLLIDMPPGTGDIQLTLAQKVPVAAAVIVTTPQDIALIDAVKGIAMFDKVQVPVLGVIENMSYHLCKNCGHKSHLFGEGGGENIVHKYQSQLLGQLPLNIDIRQHADDGESILSENSTNDIAQQYRKIATNIAGQLFLQLDSRSPTTADIQIIKE